MKGLALISAFFIFVLSVFGFFTQGVFMGALHHGQTLLSADMVVSLPHALHQEQRQMLAERFILDEGRHLKTYLHAKGHNQLVMVHVPSSVYPLYGTLPLSPDKNLHDLLAPDKEGLSGIVVHRHILISLRLKKGEKVRIGQGAFIITGVIDKTPHLNPSTPLSPPVVFLSSKALSQTQLVSPSSLISHHVRLKHKYRKSFSPREPDQSFIRSVFQNTPITIKTYAHPDSDLSELMIATKRFFLLMGFCVFFSGIGALFYRFYVVGADIKRWAQSFHPLPFILFGMAGIILVISGFLSALVIDAITLQDLFFGQKFWDLLHNSHILKISGLVFILPVGLGGVLYVLIKKNWFDKIFSQNKQILKGGFVSLYQPIPALCFALVMGLSFMVVGMMFHFHIYLKDHLSSSVPSLFLTNIQKHQKDDVKNIINTTPYVKELTTIPFFRAKTTHIKGEPTQSYLEKYEISQTFSRLIKSDGLVSSHTHENGLSVDMNMAKGLGLRLKDKLTFNMLSQLVTLRIQSFHKPKPHLDGTVFSFMVSSNLLKKMPHPSQMIVSFKDFDIPSPKIILQTELQLQDQLKKRFPHIVSYHIKDPLHLTRYVFVIIKKAAMIAALICFYLLWPWFL